MTKLDAGLITSLPASDSGSSAVWDSKRINPQPQSCLCLTCSGYPSNDDDGNGKSPAKCQYLPISRKSCNINNVYTNNYIIPFTFSVFDLGVVISSDLKWNNHISKIVAKASISSYHISHSFNSNNIRILLRVYTTYVRPKLEYNTSIGSPYLIKDIAKIKSVQK